MPFGWNSPRQHHGIDARTHAGSPSIKCARIQPPTLLRTCRLHSHWPAPTTPAALSYIYTVRSLYARSTYKPQSCRCHKTPLQTTRFLVLSVKRGYHRPLINLRNNAGVMAWLCPPSTRAPSSLAQNIWIPARTLLRTPSIKCARIRPPTLLRTTRLHFH